MTDLHAVIDAHHLGHQQTGNETYVRNLVEQLATRPRPGLRVTALHTGGAPAAWADFSRRIWPHQALVRIPVSLPWALWRLRADVAHFNYIKPPLCPCPTVLTVHDISYEIFPEYFHPLALRRMRLLIPQSARTATELITVSEASKTEMVQRYGLDPRRITVTMEAASAAFRVLSQEKIQEATARFALRSRCLLAVGNLQPRKNIVRLLECFARLRRTDRIPHQLVLVGQKGWKGESITAHIDRLGLAADVLVTGFVSEEELVALYNHAEVFIYPSVYEGFGLPILEAMACGTPVITSATTSMPEVAGEAALLVDPLSEDAIQAAIQRLCEDGEVRQQLSRSGLARAAEFSWTKMAEETLAVYRRAAGRRP